ncbi:MAG: gliding motility-associated C-terminal domain-containing protein [Bacteroidota bacterium]
MRKTIPFLIFILILCVNQNLLSNITDNIESKIVFGKEYMANNCLNNKDSNGSNRIPNLSNDYTYYTWHTFQTPKERRVIELHLTSLDLGENSTLVVYDEFKSAVVWSASNLSKTSKISTQFVNLYPDSEYHILVNSNQESNGSYLLELNIGALPPPTNDLCEGAIHLGTLNCQDNGVITSDPNATPDPEATGNCGTVTHPGQWYTYTTPDPLEFGAMHFFTPVVNIDYGILEIFSTTSGCDGLVYVDCFNPIANGYSFGLDFEPGTTYYFLVSGDFDDYILQYNINFFSFTTCNNPFWDDWWWWSDWWDKQVEFANTTDCLEPSSSIPCKNDHVAWYEFTTGCSESDLTIQVNENLGAVWWQDGAGAEEISITILANDCTTILSEYDVNGLGYVCSSIGNGESLILEDLPPNFTFLLAFGSALNELGWFVVSMTSIADDYEEVTNDICPDVEILQSGINTNLTNFCAGFDNTLIDSAIPGCAEQSEATVWYEFDLGDEIQDVTINLISQGIGDPAIAAFEECVASLIGSVCGNTLELTCINGPILIDVGSSFADQGDFDLEINTAPSPHLIPEVIVDDICSGEETDIVIDIPGGSLVDVNVTVGPGSSALVTGAMNQIFTGVSSVTINQELINTSSTAQEVIYIISTSIPTEFCTSEEVEVSIMVNPTFEVIPLAYEECLPYLLTVDVSEVITGGTLPYNSVFWYWNGIDLISNLDELSYSLDATGQITVEVIDNAGCTASAEIEVEIEDIITPTFTFPLEYCRPEHDFIDFPDISLEGMEGTWDIPIIDLSVFTDNGFFDFTFTPDASFCSFPIDVTIEIIEGEEPEFDLPEIICAEDDSFTFPTEDLNGVAGTWDIPVIDLSTTEGVQFNTFTPSSTQECLSNFEYIFEVGTSIELDFGEPDVLCRSDAPFDLSSSSMDGFEGSWDVNTIDPGQVAGDVFTATWTPFEGQSPCIGSTTINVSIVEPVTPEFTLPDELCSHESIYIFPTMDNQSINGSWSIDTIHPNEINGFVESVFTAVDGCVLEYTWEIEIMEPLVPEFSLETEFCTLDELYTLPTISENGIEGNWSQPSIDPSMHVGEQLTIEFQGASSESCVESVELTFNVTEAIDPIFDLPEKLCWEDEDLVLPPTSDNAIAGNWEPAIIDIQSNLGTTVTSTFSAENGICATIRDVVFELVAPYDVQATAIDPTGCIEEDGSIEIEVLQGDNLEFSLDNGLTWQADNTFTSLGSGGYTILVRSNDFTSCQLSLETFLNSNDGPVISNVQSSDITSCIVENGSIVINAEGDNLEYSIDEGNSWQVSNEFTGLPAGTYEISIRKAMSDCIVETSTVIADLPMTEIMTVNSQEVSDCNADDGWIEILAAGESLEFSIDNGISWSPNNSFNDLPSGIYMIQVRSIVGNDCLDSDMVELSNPNQPILITWDVQPPTVCQPTTGSLEVEADGDNLEFSIDGGTTWQDENLFTNLMAGDYAVIIRDREKTNCIDEATVEIVDEPEVLSASMIDVVLPSDCEMEDGSLFIINTESDLEYSIDGGMTWQMESEFAGLAAGTYQVITRKILLPDCRVEQEAVIPESECPCGDLILEFAKDKLNCSGEGTSTVELVSVQGMINPEVKVLWQDGTQGQLNENVGEGWQYVMIEYDEYCEWLDSIYMDVLAPIQYEWNIQDLDCPEAKNGSIEIVNVEGGSGNYSYALDGENYQSENRFAELEAGSYRIYVRDDTDCIEIKELEISAQDKIDISLPEIESLNAGERIVLDPGVDASRIDGFLWTDGQGFENTSDLILEVSPVENTTYTIEVYYGDCIETHEISVEILNEEGIHMSNAFSPNGDGMNDRFFIQGGTNSSIELNGFTILDRWGNKMFVSSQPEFNNAEDGWDGFYQGRRVSAGVYIYQIIYMEDGRSEVWVGTVTVVD